MNEICNIRKNSHNYSGPYMNIKFNAQIWICVYDKMKYTIKNMADSKKKCLVENPNESGKETFW